MLNTGTMKEAMKEPTAPHRLFEKCMRCDNPKVPTCNAVMIEAGVTIYILYLCPALVSHISTQHHHFEPIITETYIIRLAESCRINPTLFYSFIMNWWRQTWNIKCASSDNY
jgi:hypothetical protein